MIRATTNLHYSLLFGSLGSLERNVPEEEFWALFNETVHEYNILASDLCLVEGNYVSCEEFLEQSFQDPFAPLSE